LKDGYWGTRCSSDYLWGVLIKQAYVDAIVDLILLIIVAYLGIVLWKTHIWLSGEWKGETHSRYQELEEEAVFPMIIGAVMWIIIMAVNCSNISNIVTGFINPGYWALNKILHFIK
jgi:ABC-type phosphate transport system permease subunit